MDAICRLYKIHPQGQKVTFEDDDQLYTAQSGYCSFHPRRANKTQKIEHIKLSYCQKNKWEDDWAQYWFYAKISFPASGPSAAVSYPLSAKVLPFNHVSKANFKRTAAGYKDCCAAFATATSVIGGRDLVEEYVVSKVWPLSCGWLPKEFTKIKIDHLVKELPYPRFGWTKPEGITDEFIVEDIWSRMLWSWLGRTTPRSMVCSLTVVTIKFELISVFAKCKFHITLEGRPTRKGEGIWVSFNGLC